MSDVVSVGRDGRSPGAGMPRHDRGRKQGDPPKQPALWNAVEVLDGPAQWGQYPRGFLSWALSMLQASPREVLHVCSGSLPAAAGLRVDIRAECRPDVVADGRALPFANSTFSAVLIDPPYAVEYAEDLYGVEYPRPRHLLMEAARVVQPGGRVGFVHYLVPAPPPGCAFELVRGITVGCGYRIRAYTQYLREQPSLLNREAAP